MPLQKGSIVRATIATGVCDEGELGVCYEVYRLGGRPGYSILFAGGRCDGFSPAEVVEMLEDTGMVSESGRKYDFLNVIRLEMDFRRGVFNDAFGEGLRLRQ